MELLVTARDNEYVVVFQDLFTKCYPTPDQKAVRIAHLYILVEEIVTRRTSFR